MKYKYTVTIKRRLNVLSPLPNVNKEEKFSFLGDNCAGLLEVYYEIIWVLSGISSSNMSNNRLSWTSMFLPELNSYVSPNGGVRKRLAKSKHLIQERKDNYIYEMSINIQEV